MKYGNANCGQMSFINAKTYVNVYGANETEVQIGKSKKVSETSNERVEFRMMKKGLWVILGRFV
jgi:hypothetical protein